MMSAATLFFPGVLVPRNLAERLDDALLEAVAQTIVYALSESELVLFEELLTAENDEGLRAFLLERAPSIAPLMDACIGELKTVTGAVASALT
jgi:hypothetical protein